MLTTFYDAYRVLNEVYGRGAYLKQALNDVPIDEHRRAHTTKLCYGVLDRDVTLGYYLNCLCDKRPKSAVRIILKISLYAIDFLKTAPYAVVNASVELVKKLGKGANAGFVNAVLRRFDREKIPYPSDRFERMSVEYSYPLFAVKRLVADYGEETARDIMCYDEAVTSVRFSDGIDAEAYLDSKGYTSRQRILKNTYIIDKFKRNSDYDEGLYTFQSVGSVAICEAVGKGDALLDCCAAPGGKSVLLAGSFREVVSCEIHAHRAELIREYAERMKVKNISVITCDSMVYREEFDEKFDCVLADVPCSGFGVLTENPDIKVRRTESDVMDLSEVQYAILSNVSRYVKSGGRLCYSTCSVFDSENDGISGRFLKAHADFKCVGRDSPLPHFNRRFGMQFLPHISFGAGFYFAEFVKRK